MAVQPIPQLPARQASLLKHQLKFWLRHVRSLAMITHFRKQQKWVLVVESMSPTLETQMEF